MSKNNASWDSHPSVVALHSEAKEINDGGGLPCITCWLPGSTVVVVENDVMLNSTCLRGHKNTLARSVVSHLVELRQNETPAVRNYDVPKDLAS